MKKIILALLCLSVVAPSYSMAAKKKRYPQVSRAERESSSDHDPVEVSRYRSRAFSEYCSSHLRSDGMYEAYDNSPDGMYYGGSSDSNPGNGQI